MFLDFLYANCVLKPAPGMEDQVAEINVYAGADYINSFYQFSPEELAVINKTSGVWLSMMGVTYDKAGKRVLNWPPLKVDAFVPQNIPLREFLIFNETTREKMFCIAYLDLNLIVLRVDPDEESFIWKRLPDASNDLEGNPCDMWDLQFRNRGGDFVHQGNKYLFGEPLEICGKLADLERLQPLKMIYPILEDSMLILMQKEAVQPGKIVDMNGHALAQ